MNSVLENIVQDYQSAEFTCMFLHDKKATNKLIRKKLAAPNKLHYIVFADTNLKSKWQIKKDIIISPDFI